MITESFRQYKGYTIRLRAATGSGFGYAIIKEKPNEASPNGMKKVYLRQRKYVFVSSDFLLLEAMNYIDNHENNLIDKYNKS